MKNKNCITPEEAKTIIQEGEQVIFLDVRTKTEFESGHIHGAWSVPLSSLASVIQDLPADSLYIIACGKGGGRSEDAATLMQEKGYKARTLCGGTLAWLAN